MEIHFAQEMPREELTPVDNRFIADYMPGAQGLWVQVYLYGLMQCHFPSMRGISVAEALDISETAVTDAFVYWQEKGLVRIVSADPLTVEYLPIGGGKGMEPSVPIKYAPLVQSLRTLTAPREFGMRELSQVYEWIELYGLSEGAVLMLVSHCLERKHNCPIGYMTKVAQDWSLAGVRTQEQAMERIRDSDVRGHGSVEILKAWHLRRPPTRDEMERYDRWTKEWGFSHEAVLEALPRLSRSAAPSFAKLEETLDELRRAGKTDAAAIRMEDASRGVKAEFARRVFEAAGKPGTPTEVQSNQIHMFMEKGFPEDVILYAAELSRGKNEPFGYLKTILIAWDRKGIRTREAAEADAAAPVSGRAATHKKSDYSNSELEKLEVDLNAEGRRL